MAVISVMLPYLPLAGLFGFVPLPWPVLADLTAITALCVAASELAKGLFYSRHGA